MVLLTNSSSSSTSIGTGDDYSNGSSCNRSTVFILSCLPENGQIDIFILVDNEK